MGFTATYVIEISGNKDEIQAILDRNPYIRKGSQFSRYQTFLKAMKKSLKRFERKTMKAIMLAKSRFFGENLNESLLHPGRSFIYFLGNGI